ncbi:MAG: hypothetical protein AAFY88_31140, partial [Acidobacteriota bacterium]
MTRPITRTPSIRPATRFATRPWASAASWPEARIRRPPTRSALILSLALALMGGALAPADAQLVPQTSPFDVSTALSTCAGGADVAVAPDGRFVVVWHTISGSTLLWRRFDADAQPLEAVQSLNVGDQII